MERQRSILIGLFAVVTYFLFLAWQEDYGNTQEYPQPATHEVAANLPDTAVDIPESQSSIPVASTQSAVPVTDVVSQKVSKQLIQIKTDVLQLSIDPVGGNIVSSKLLAFTVAKNQKEVVYLLTNENDRVYLAESGLLGKNTPDGSAQKLTFSTTSNEYVLGENQNILEIPLTVSNSDGVIFTKLYRLRRGSYLVDLDYSVENNSNESLNTRLYTQLLRDQLPNESQGGGLGMQAYLGAAYSTQETRYQKYDFEDIADDIVEDKKPLKEKTQGGWVGMLQHYFLTAWIPEQDKVNTLYTLKTGDNVAIGSFQPAVAIAPGIKTQFKAQLYVGPKDQDVLETIAPGLDLTVDYGILWWIGQPIFALLKMLHSLLGNWGVAIIMVTVVVKLLLFPLSNAQYRSFAKMRKLQPKMQALKERYGDDRQKMGKATMELYKKEKVNPLGGCLPLLIQMPVFFALYWVLMESIELRQAPFMLWIEDLAIKDPLFILPLLMGASMFLMQKMQPTAPNMDPTQQKIMQFMPVMMTVFFLFFPAGLVLYWVVNNTLSIAQQLAVTKMIEREDEKTAQKSGKQ